MSKEGKEDTNQLTFDVPSTTFVCRLLWCQFDVCQFDYDLQSTLCIISAKLHPLLILQLVAPLLTELRIELILLFGSMKTLWDMWGSEIAWLRLNSTFIFFFPFASSIAPAILIIRVRVISGIVLESGFAIRNSIKNPERRLEWC